MPSDVCSWVVLNRSQDVKFCLPDAAYMSEQLTLSPGLQFNDCLGRVVGMFCVQGQTLVLLQRYWYLAESSALSFGCVSVQHDKTSHELVPLEAVCGFVVLHHACEFDGSSPAPCSISRVPRKGASGIQHHDDNTTFFVSRFVTGS